MAVVCVQQAVCVVREALRTRPGRDQSRVSPLPSPGHPGWHCRPSGGSCGLFLNSLGCLGPWIHRILVRAGIYGANLFLRSGRELDPEVL